MKYIFFIFCLSTFYCNAQEALTYDKKFEESEDRWVAFNNDDNDSSHLFGFIYIDPEAGLTLHRGGSFTISSSGKFIRNLAQLDSISLKVRLGINSVRVAFIPEKKYKELGIEAIPEWLKYYKTDTNSIQRLYKWGFMYNGWENCKKALTYLERAQKIDPYYPGLAVELAFSYNCLSEYDKAITVLKLALVKEPLDAYTNKELVYALVKFGQLDYASISCKRAISMCTDKSYNGEMCYNLLHQYYVNKDKEHFDAWLTDTKKWNADHVERMNSIKTMEDELKN